VIIVEGPDGAGKTTLIKSLLERWPFLELAPRVVSKDAEAMVDLPAWIADSLEHWGEKPMLFDRHRLISETIYGPILRGSAEQGFDDPIQMLLWMGDFYRCQPIIIYCLPPLQVVRENIWDDPDNVVVQGKIDAIYQAYCARAAIDEEATQARVFIYDYTKDGREDDPLATFNGVMRHIERKFA